MAAEPRANEEGGPWARLFITRAAFTPFTQKKATGHIWPQPPGTTLQLQQPQRTRARSQSYLSPLSFCSPCDRQRQSHIGAPWISTPPSTPARQHTIQAAAVGIDPPPRRARVPTNQGEVAALVTKRLVRAPLEPFLRPIALLTHVSLTT